MYYTINEVAEKFNVDRTTVYRWFDQGLQRTKIGTTVRIDEEDLNKFMKKE